METTSLRYWPFEVVPANEQTEQHRREIAFLNAAHSDGFKVYAFGFGDDYGATGGDGRQGEIIRRGRARWEVRLYDGESRTAVAYVGDFTCAGAAVVEWLRGMD